MKNQLDVTQNIAVNEPTILSLSQIRRDGGTQPRASINHQTVLEYIEDMKNGDTFPPVIVFYDGTYFWLCDGFHRAEAANGAGLTEIAAIVKQGTRRDAVLYSVGANAKHGLRRTNADKRRAVMTLLEDSDWSHWSDREIARHCQVDHKTVGKLRATLTGEIPSNKSLQSVDGDLSNLTGEIPSNKSGSNRERTYTTKHGTQAKMNTANIGKGKSSKSLPPSAEDKEVTLKTEDKVVNTPSEEVQSPSSEEINHPSNTTTDNTTTDNATTDNAPPNIRNLLAVGDLARIKDGRQGIVTFIPNRKCAVVEFSPGNRKIIQLEDFDFSATPQPKPQRPVKKEIIIQEGLNYFAGSPCKWYVEVEEKTYLRLQEYREKVGTATIDGALARFLEEEKEKTPNSDDLVLYFLANVKQLPSERVYMVLEAFAKAHYDAFVQVYEVIEH